MEDAGLSQTQTPPAPRKRKTWLIVLSVITAAFLLSAVGIICLTIAIPTFLNLRKQANEKSARQSLREIHQAQIQYNQTFPARGYACDLRVLGGAVGTVPTPQAAQLLPDDLAGGHKNGYNFMLINCDKVKANGQDMNTSYETIAVPEIPRKTGDRGFCADITGAVKADPKGGTDCTVPIQ